MLRYAGVSPSDASRRFSCLQGRKSVAENDFCHLSRRGRWLEGAMRWLSSGVAQPKGTGMGEKTQPAKPAGKSGALGNALETWVDPAFRPGMACDYVSVLRDL